MDVDFFKNTHTNIRCNYIGKRKTVISNPIEEINSYVVINMSIQYRNIFNKDLTAFLNVNNVFDEEYYHPGTVDAGAGEDTSKPSKTWYSSRIPQPERNFIFGLKTRF